MVEIREQGPRGRRPVEVIAAIAIAAGATGLISGVEGTRRERPPSAAPPPAAAPGEARSYRDMQERAYGPNAELPAAWLRGIRVAPDQLVRVAQGEAYRERARARRAYDGAPPVIPHPVDDHAAPACASCHEHGAVVGGLVAPIMSHARRESCLQCHVASVAFGGLR